MSVRHACLPCVTGAYRDERREHDSLCSRLFDPRKGDLVANNAEGLLGMEGVDCPECLVAFDQWAAARTEDQINWTGATA